MLKSYINFSNPFFIININSMNSKIVILDDSVILYQHFISDDNWETVMAFPRGGLTYLIKNDNIKFFAYIDYFYRNCLMTMDLPLYIVDEELGIDGEYSDIEELTELLNRIFPALNGDVDLTPYLKKREAAELYQPIGDYQPSGNYFDDVEYDSSGKTIDFYSQGTLVDSIDARPFIKDGMVDSVTLIELSGDTYLHIVFNTDAGKQDIDIPLGDMFDADNYYTKDEVDGLLDDKLDASAYTPTDLSNYYTKQQVDELIPEVPSLDGYATETWVKNQGYINQLKTINNISLIGEGNIQIGSGGTIDAYTKAEADARFQPKGDYVTEATVIQYITNLQEQITNIIQTVSGCCAETGETQYRWITMTGANDYICSGTTKYNKEKKQQSTDGINWTDVSPLETRRGSTVLEVNSPDCGYVPEPQYRWKAAPVSDYMCIGTDKYYKVYYEVSYDNGVTWQHVVPEQTKRGNLIESASTDCGYIEYQYRWYQAPASDYMCSGTSKYYKEYYQVSTDGGQTWTNVSPTQTRQGSLIEVQSEDCGYIPQRIKLTLVYNDGMVHYKECDEYDYTRSTDTHYREDNYNIKSAIIGECVNAIGVKTFMYCTSLSSVTIPNNVVTFDTGSFYNCSSLNNVEIPSGLTTMKGEVFSGCTSLESINIPDGVIGVSGSAFGNCTSLEYVTIGTGCTAITSNAFDGCVNLKSVTIKALTPPHTTLSPFKDTNNTFKIYVPASVVNTYKNSTYWREFANRIQAIP